MATIMCKCSISYKDNISKLLDRGPWLLHRPDSLIQKIPLETVAGRSSSSSLYLVRDDLIHPVYGGNKARKLDAILPRLVLDKVTDIVSKMRNKMTEK